MLGDSELLSQDRSGNTSYYLADGQGSTRALTDSAGNVTDRYSYDAYGSVRERQGTTVNPYHYTGQQFDAETGLTYMRARYYSIALAVLAIGAAVACILYKLRADAS